MNGVEQFLSFFPRGDSDSRLIKCAEDERDLTEDILRRNNLSSGPGKPAGVANKAAGLRLVGEAAERSVESSDHI